MKDADVFLSSFPPHLEWLLFTFTDLENVFSYVPNDKHHYAVLSVCVLDSPILQI